LGDRVKSLFNEELAPFTDADIAYGYYTELDSHKHTAKKTRRPSLDDYDEGRFLFDPNLPDEAPATTDEFDDDPLNW